MILNAEKIFKVNDTPELTKVNVPEWGGDVYISIMDGASRDRWEISVPKALESPGTANIRASLLVATLCDESGKRMFTDNQAANLGSKSGVVLDRLYATAKKLNRLDEEDIDELGKNSGAALHGGSGSN